MRMLLTHSFMRAPNTEARLASDGKHARAATSTADSAGRREERETSVVAGQVPTSARAQSPALHDRSTPPAAHHDHGTAYDFDGYDSYDDDVEQTRRDGAQLPASERSAASTRSGYSEHIG